MNLYIPFSIGNAIDRYSKLNIDVLECNHTEKELVQSEIDKLYLLLNDFINKYNYEYNCLTIINNIIRNLKKNNQNYFLHNDARFIIKNRINMKSNSAIMEHKNYTDKTVILLKNNSKFDDNKEILYIYKKYLLIYFNDVIIINIKELSKYNTPAYIFSLNEDTKYTFIENFINNDLYSVVSKQYLIEKNQLSDNIIHYICGGALGDIIHCLYVIKSMYQLTGKRGQLSLINQWFTRPYEIMYKDTYKFILSQEYIHSYDIEPEKSLSTQLNYDLSSWRNSHLLFKTDWLSLLSDHYKLPLVKEPWIICPTVNHTYNNKILIHRSSDPLRYVNSFPWQNIVKKNECIFITCSQNEYDMFPYKTLVKHIIFNNYSEFASAIYNCKFYIGNQSSPLALATSFFKPCLAELSWGDEAHNRGFSNYNNNYFWISNTASKIDNLTQWIQI